MSGGVATSVNIKHKLYSLVNVHLFMDQNQRFPSSENIKRFGLQPSEKQTLEKELLKYRPLVAYTRTATTSKSFLWCLSPH